ncbi:MAG: hypothetical protein AAGD22_06880 [Verrucomicrobiota bacterium]
MITDNVPIRLRVLMEAVIVWVVPAFLIVLLVSLAEPFAYRLPHRDDWHLLEGYRQWMTGEESWTHFFDLHMGHWYVFMRATYYPFFHLTGGDLASLRVISFFICGLISWQLIRLAEPMLASPVWLKAIWAVLTVGAVFSPAQVLIWTWGMIFANIIPWLCLTSGMLVMRRHLSWGGTLFWCALLALTATFYFGTGLLVWIVLPIFYWMTSEAEMRKERWRFTWAWAGLFVVVVAGYFWRWLEWRQVWSDRRGMTLEVLWERPWGVVHYLLSLLGALPSVGLPVFAYDSAPWFGGLFMGMFGASVVYVVFWRQDRQLRYVAAPWICLGMAVLGAAALICIGRLQESSATAHSPHFQTTCLYFGLAAFFLAATVLVHRWGIAILKGMGAGVVYGVIGMVLATGWVRGRQEMEHYSHEMRQKASALAFLDVLPFEELDPLTFDAVHGRTSADLERGKKLVDYLRERDLYRRVYFLSDGGLDAFRRSGDRATPRSADVTEVVKQGSGRQVLRGHAILSAERRPSDIVVLMVRPLGASREESRVIDIIRPRAARYEPYRSWQYRDLVAGWEYVIDPAKIPDGEQVVSFYTFEQPKRKVTEFGPEFVFRDGELVERIDVGGEQG